MERGMSREWGKIWCVQAVVVARMADTEIVHVVVMSWPMPWSVICRWCTS